MRFHLSLRGTNIVSNEAIHNVSNPKILNGEIQDYGLPRLRTKSRNDNNNIGSMCDGLPQPLTRLRNDANCIILFIQHYRLPRVINHVRNDIPHFVIARQCISATKQSIILHTLYLQLVSLRGMNKMRDEAIYNLAQMSLFNGILKSEILNYGLPQKFFKFSRNDNNDIGSMRDGLPRLQTKSRNDAVESIK